MLEREQTAQSVGQFLILKRNEKGMSQGELASKIGVTQKMISRWERGETVIKGPFIKLLAEALDSPPVNFIVNVFPEKTKKPRVTKASIEDFLKSIPVVGAASAGTPVEMEPSQTKETLFDVLGRFPSNVMAVKVCGNSMSFMGDQSISDGDYALIDPNHKNPSELIGKVVCVRIDSEEHLIKELIKVNDKFYLRSWNPTFPPIEIKNGDARIEGLVVLIFKPL